MSRYQNPGQLWLEAHVTDAFQTRFTSELCGEYVHGHEIRSKKSSDRYIHDNRVQIRWSFTITFLSPR